MEFDYCNFSEYLNSVSSIISVEAFPDGTYGNIRIAAVNSDFLKMAEDYGVIRETFVPDQPYEKYIPKNKIFEDCCCRSAVHGETLRTYIKYENAPVWIYLTLIPLRSDKPNVKYCAVLQTNLNTADYSLMTNIAPDITADVLRICVKLRSSNDFMTSINDVICDIGKLCGSEHTCIFLTDFSQRKCSVLCESLSENTHLSSMKVYVNDEFFTIVDTWLGSIGGNTCVILKDENDWQYLKETNRIWYDSMEMAGAKSLVLFPLKYRNETLGFIWAINFDVSQTLKIKEMLELATYFLASEIASYQLFSKLEALSSKDLLTGVFNRNAMNDRVDALINTQHRPDDPLCVIFADLNGLKQVNDTGGHFAGDLLLKDAALTLQKHFPEYEVYRTGGDEFMILALNAERGSLEQRIIAFRKAISDPDGVCFAVGYSFKTIMEIGEAMKEADKNMYADKAEFYRKHPDMKR